MPTDPSQHLTFEGYQQAADALHVLSGMLLFEFARHDGGTRDQIARNFIAKADATVQGVLRLWEIKDYGDCWILHRALLDRLFHLHVINTADEFDAFDDWSFKRQYEAAARVRSDPALQHLVSGLVADTTPEQEARYRRLVNEPPTWRRPKAETVAKDMGLTFLYRYGYDFASTHVHPMSTDGQEDFFTFTGLEPRPQFADWRSVLSNSILVATMIQQEALNASTLSWRKVVFDAVDGVRESLLSDSPVHHLPLAKVSVLFRDGVRLAQPRTGTEEQVVAQTLIKRHRRGAVGRRSRIPPCQHS